MCAGLFMGGPRLLLSQQVVFWHRAPLGRPIQERDHPPLVAQPWPEEGDLELHPLCFRNTVSNCLFFLLLQKPCFSWWSVDKYVCVYRYDDYDYGEVNQLLERDLKLYIKAVACFPDATKTPVCPLSMAPLKTSERVRKPTPVNSQPSFCTVCESVIFFPSDTREFTDHGGAAAGWAAIRSESHHSVHDCLSAWRGTKLELSAGTERPRDTRIKKSQQQTVKWDDSGNF